MARDNKSLFQWCEDYHNNACIGFTHNGLDLYAIGFKRAADALVEHVVSTNNYIDTIVYPIIFLYRHYCELRLKDIISDGGKLLDKEIVNQQIHNLDSLWCKAREIIVDVFQESNEDELLEADDFIKQISIADPFATAFRYPTDKRNNPSLLGIKHINIRNFKDIIDRVSLILEGVAMAIGAYLDNKQEMESYYSDNF